MTADRQHVEHRLGGMGMVAIARIDDGNIRTNVFGNEVRRTGITMAHNKHVGGHGLQILQRVVQCFALAGGRGRDVQVEHVRR